MNRGSARRKAASYTGQQGHRKTQAYIHASSGIRTYDPSVPAREDLKPYGHCDRSRRY
jgi:hypothetical protein